MSFQDPPSWPLVLVEWVDSLGCSATWAPLSSLAVEQTVCRSVGWLAHRDAESLTIIPHRVLPTERIDAQGCGDMTIPAAAVRHVYKLSLSSFDTR